jgi:UDP-glucose 4-epimerase
MSKTCLITGINGFLASYAAAEFTAAGYDVIGIHHSNNPSALALKKQYHLHLPSHEIESVIRTEKPDVVIHAAGTANVGKSVETPYEDFMISVPATANLLDSIRKESPKTLFFFLSSAAVYGNPTVLPISENSPIAPISPYGFHKRMGELLCDEYRQIYGLQTYVLRIFSAYGKGLRRQAVFDLVKNVLNFAMDGKPMSVFGTGNESRDFIHASDIARCLVHLTENRPTNHIINVASGNETSIKELLALISEGSNIQPKIEFTNVVRSGDPLNWRADISPLSKTGFSPTVSLKSGISEMIQWLTQ